VLLDDLPGLVGHTQNTSTCVVIEHIASSIGVGDPRQEVVGVRIGGDQATRAAHRRDAAPGVGDAQHPPAWGRDANDIPVAVPAERSVAAKAISLADQEAIKIVVF